MSRDPMQTDKNMATNNIEALLKRVRHDEDCDPDLVGTVGRLLVGKNYPPFPDDYMTSLSDTCALLQQVLPDWFLLRLGEFRNPVVYAGDTHTVRADAHLRCVCELQHFKGGLLTTAHAPTLPRAIVAAMLTVRMREEW